MYEDFLRKVPLFAELPDEDLTRLCQMTGEVRLSPGQVLFDEGSLADTAYILYQGEVEIVKNVDGREVFIDLKDEPVTAVLRSAAQLQTSLNHSEQARIALERLQLTAVQQEQVAALVRQVQAAASQPLALDAQLFWRKVLSRYTQDQFVEVPMDTDEWTGPVFSFDNGSA